MSHFHAERYVSPGEKVPVRREKTRICKILDCRLSDNSLYYHYMVNSEESQVSPSELLFHEHDGTVEACLMCGLLRNPYIPGSTDDHCPRCNFKEGCCYS